MGWALATRGLGFYALITQLLFSDLCSTVVCVEVTIRSVFGELRNYEGVLNTESTPRDIYMYMQARRKQIKSGEANSDILDCI